MEPVTGVTDISHLSEHGGFIFFERVTEDLGWKEHLEASPECRRDPASCTCDWCDQSLVGDWKRTWVWRIGGRTGRNVASHTPGSRRYKVWTEDRNGPMGWSAIYNRDEMTIQVGWSKWTKEDAAWCSPCYPNQGDIDTDGGGVVCFTLPPELLTGGES